MDHSAHLVDALAVAWVQRAQAEAAQTVAMLALHDAELARIDADPSPLRRVAERGALVLEIAQVLGLSEGQTFARIAAAQRVRDHAPTTWQAYVAGTIDDDRLREVAGAVDRLTRPASWEALDERVVAYAGEHTVAELRVWLRRFVQRVEADVQMERAEQAREERHVQVDQVEDSMAWLNAYLPAHVAAAIERRLHRAARTLHHDPRTQSQRQADLLAAWLTTGEPEHTDATVAVDIAVSIEADVLSGLTDGYAESSDGTWAVPASWLLAQIDAQNTFWHRMLIEPLTGDVLAHQYVGRFAPDVLTRAIAFRDGVCRAPGCRVPAHRCDIDHRQPWPTGTTTADNLWALCRRHHRLKSHHTLRWILPSGLAAPTRA